MNDEFINDNGKEILKKYPAYKCLLIFVSQAFMESYSGSRVYSAVLFKCTPKKNYENFISYECVCNKDKEGCYFYPSDKVRVNYPWIRRSLVFRTQQDDSIKIKFTEPPINPSQEKRNLSEDLDERISKLENEVSSLFDSLLITDRALISLQNNVLSLVNIKK